MQSMNIKITVKTDIDREGSFSVIVFIGKYINVFNFM